MEAESGYVAVGGTEMYWESRGSGGPPLLLVHGHAGLPLLYGVIALESALASLFDPAKNALLPTLVAEDQRYLYLRDRFRLNVRGHHKHMTPGDLERNQRIRERD